MKHVLPVRLTAGAVLSTEGGRHGVLGEHALLHVEEEHRREAVVVLILQLHVAAVPVPEAALNHNPAIPNPVRSLVATVAVPVGKLVQPVHRIVAVVPSTEDGQAGALGVAVLYLVVVEPNPDLVRVQIRPHRVGEPIVPEVQQNPSRVIPNLVWAHVVMVHVMVAPEKHVRTALLIAAVVPSMVVGQIGGPGGPALQAAEVELNPDLVHVPIRHRPAVGPIAREAQHNHKRVILNAVLLVGVGAIGVLGGLVQQAVAEALKPGHGHAIVLHLHAEVRDVPEVQQNHNPVIPAVAR